jgi:hypothetical protein
MQMTKTNETKKKTPIKLKLTPQPAGVARPACTPNGLGGSIGLCGHAVDSRG